MVRLGIVGPGRIVDRVMTDMGNTKEITLYAVASRSMERARAAAERYHIPRVYDSYEALAQDPDVDLVYIATPHPCHLEQAMLMMRNGKNVLCEKPMTVNDREMQAMIACARENSVFLMEAMWTRFMPATIKARELVESGAIGEVRHLCGNFSYPGRYDENDRVYALNMAGGALLDLGVYPIMEITMFLGWKPEKVTAYACKAPTGADMRTSGQMIFKNGATAQFFCGMDADADNRMTVYGSKGYLDIEDFWHATRLVLHETGKEPQVFAFAPENEGHHYEFDHAARCVQEGLKESPVVTLEESLAISRICTEMRREMGVVYPMD